MLAPILIEPLRDHLAPVRRLHDRDPAGGHGEVWLPHALARKYPLAGKEWAWQYVFRGLRLSGGPGEPRNDTRTSTPESAPMASDTRNVRCDGRAPL
jgi:hypothetical protein